MWTGTSSRPSIYALDPSVHFSPYRSQAEGGEAGDGEAAAAAGEGEGEGEGGEEGEEGGEDLGLKLKKKKKKKVRQEEELAEVENLVKQEEEGGKEDDEGEGEHVATTNFLKRISLCHVRNFLMGRFHARWKWRGCCACCEPHEAG